LLYLNIQSTPNEKLQGFSAVKSLKVVIA